MMNRIEIDGNDGTGKSTLVKRLKAEGYDVYDRGIATQMTDDDKLICKDDAIHIILDVPPNISQERLLEAGKDLRERFHTLPDLVFYRKRFKAVASRLPKCEIIDASGTQEETYQAAKAWIDSHLSRSSNR